MSVVMQKQNLKNALQRHFQSSSERCTDFPRHPKVIEKHPDHTGPHGYGRVFGPPCEYDGRPEGQKQNLRGVGAWRLLDSTVPLQ